MTNETMSRSETSADIDAAAAEWVARDDRGAMSAEDVRARDAWLEADPRHLGAYVRAQAVWKDMDRMGALAAGRKSPPVAARRGRWLNAVIAAAALIAVGVFGGFWFVNDMTGRESAEIGELRSLALKDGSVVMLNTGSVIQTRFNDEARRVMLRRGEASFQVAKTDRPFIVETGEISVTAIGTKFTVRRNAGDAVEVIVEEGVVEVLRRERDGDPDRQVLRANRSLAIVAAQPLQPVSLSAAETQRRLSWQQGRLIFDGESLREAAAEMNRYSPKKIFIADSALAEQEFVGAFRIGDSRAFADAIATAYGVDVKENDATLRIETRR